VSIVTVADALYALARPLLFRFDAERSHRLVFTLLKSVETLLARSAPVPPTAAALQQELWGLRFPNPIGLAAGFDKNAELPHVWPLLGFGFAELGTVTAHAQPGNPRPRLFRLPADRALINRLGFNNDGAPAVSAALAARLRTRPAIPLGVNLGKSRVTPLADAVSDYRASFARLRTVADYVTINVSSPNTPGLRDLQDAAQLEPLLSALQDDNLRGADGAPRPLPLLLKLSPDLREDELEAAVAVAERCGVSGLIATNTTTERPQLRTSAPVASETGGLSGAPLRDRSTAVVGALYRLCGTRLPIIGVGGILDADDAYAKIRAGASLLQVYTGLIYSGPAFPRRLALGLCARLRADGLVALGDAVGRDANECPALDRLPRAT
jgi:dihydroorotate dehydrogenase